MAEFTFSDTGKSVRIFVIYVTALFFLILLEAGRLVPMLERESAEYDLPALHTLAGILQITSETWGFAALTRVEDKIVAAFAEQHIIGAVPPALAETVLPEESSPDAESTAAETDSAQEAEHKPDTAESAQSPERHSAGSAEKSVGGRHSRPKVLLVGDSMMLEGFGPALQRALRARPDLDVLREGKYSTGLSRLDYFNWENHLAELVHKDMPDLVVICIGANDPQDIIDEKGKRHHADSSSWAEMYQNRAKKLLQSATSLGARVIWVGLPIMSREPYSTRIRRLSLLQQRACEGYPPAGSARYIDTVATLADSKGSYTSYDLDAHGQAVRLRYKDKIHVTEEGGRRMTLRVLPFIFADLGLPDQTPDTESRKKNESPLTDRNERAMLKLTIDIIKENIMPEVRKVAVPSDAPGGLEAAPSAHFGHCDLYTIANITDGKISDVQIVPNAGHEHGNCLMPVQDLASRGVNALVAGGMGMRPLSGFQAAGVTVYYSAGLPTVNAVLQAFAAGKLVPFGIDQTCKGHGHCHQQ